MIAGITEYFVPMSVASIEARCELDSTASDPENIWVGDFRAAPKKFEMPAPEPPPV